MPEPGRRRIDWGVLGVEAAAIFLSVLLGFGVAEWRDARAQSERRTALLAAFAQEAGANREGLVEKGTYHHWLVREFDAGVASGEIEILADLFRIDNMTGFNPLHLQATAWETATATGDLALLDFDIASALWQLYDAQRLMDAEQERMRAIALDEINNPTPGPVARFQTLLREFTSLEREYLYLTNDALRRLAEARGEPAPDAVAVEVFDRDPFADASTP